eukprot:6539702-Ditylum_brightwellii.AAC.1
MNEPCLSSQEEEQRVLREGYANLPTPKVRGAATSPHMIPITLVLVRSIQRCESWQQLKIMFDSGGSHTLIHVRALLPNIWARFSKDTKELQTLMGAFMMQREVTLTNIFLPELNKTKTIDSINARNTLNFKFGYMEWLEKKVTMKATVN